MPENEPNLGHSVALIGYDEGSQRFVFRNSWGPGWGDAGYGYLPYDYLERYQQEAWASTINKSDPIPRDGRAIIERSWAISEALGEILHIIELVDHGSDEVIGWSFALESDRGLE